MKIFAYVVNPLDFHPCSTVPLSTYIQWSLPECVRKNHHKYTSINLASLAVNVAMSFGCWDLNDFGDEERIHVSHDVSNDAPIFIFKMHNNGTTILVSENELSLQGRCVFESACFNARVRYDEIDPSTPPGVPYRRPR